jgi:hypothetical protein
MTLTERRVIGHEKGVLGRSRDRGRNDSAAATLTSSTATAARSEPERCSNYSDYSDPCWDQASVIDHLLSPGWPLTGRAVPFVIAYSGKQ